MMLENGKSSPRLTAPKEKEQTSSASYNIQGIFGRNLKQKRLEKGMTQEQLAEKAGVSVDTVKRYESGKYDGIRLDMAWYMADALDTPLQALLPPPGCSPEQLLCEAETLIHTARELYKTK